MFVFSFAKDVNAPKNMRSRGKKNQTKPQPMIHLKHFIQKKKKDQLSFYLIIIVTYVLCP